MVIKYARWLSAGVLLTACGAPVDVRDGAPSPTDVTMTGDSMVRDSTVVSSDVREAPDVMALDATSTDDVVETLDSMTDDRPTAVDGSANDSTARDSAVRDSGSNGGTDSAADAGRCPVVSDRATWVVTAEPAVDAAMRNALFAMFAQRRVTRVYIDVGRLLDSNSGRMSLAAYVRELRNRCISVEFLFGNRFRVDMPAEVMARANAAITYAMGAPDAMPEALHFDLEPHVFPGFGNDAATFSRVAGQYVSVLDMLGPVVRGARMRLHVDIAHWYGSRMYTAGGRTAGLDVWVAERVDGYAIMDYWGAAADAATTNRILAQTSEVATARTARIKAWVGLQVECGGAANETLCEEGTAYTESVVNALRMQFAGDSAFSGVAFYAHSGLGTLRP
jgi:hypothetical protein